MSKRLLEQDFKERFKAFIKANNALRNHLLHLGERCFLYTDGYLTTDGRDYPRMKMKAIDHCCAYHVLNPNSDDHPLTSERETGIIFDDNLDAYITANEHRRAMIPLIKEAQRYRFLPVDGVSSTFPDEQSRSIIHLWLYDLGESFVRSLAVTRTFFIAPQPYKRMTIGVWHNAAWRRKNLYQAKRIISHDATALRELNHFVKREGAFYRNEQRLSCRAVMWDEKGDVVRKALALPLIYPFGYHRDISLRTKSEKNTGRNVSEFVDMGHVSASYGLYFKPLSNER